MKRVLLIQPFLGRREKVIFPIGLHALACHLAVTRPGLEVRLLDENVAPEPEAALDRIVGEFGPELIGFSLRNIDMYQQAGSLLSLCRSGPVARPPAPGGAGSRSGGGGTGFSMYARTIMSRHREIDFGVFLEGEETLGELTERPEAPGTIKGLYYRDREGGVISRGPRPPLDLRDSPPRTRIFLEPRTLPGIRFLRR